MQQKDLKNRTLLTSLIALANTLPILPTTTKLSKTGNVLPAFVRRKKDKKKKKKVTQPQGSHFKPVNLFFHEGKPMSPAMYRRLHLGVKKKR